MRILVDELIRIIPALEEVESKFMQQFQADPMMNLQTSYFMQMGIENPELMKAGFKLYRQMMTNFHTDMSELISRFQSGALNHGGAMKQWKSMSGKYYKELFKAGTMAVGNEFYDKMGMTRKDYGFLNKARRAETGYFRKFLSDIKNPLHGAPKGTTGRAIQRYPYSQRAGFYPESGKGIFMNGMVAGTGDKMVIIWKLGIPQTEHCWKCAARANVRYTWKTLPGVPRDGSTPCLFNCYCHLQFKPRTGKLKGGDPTRGLQYGLDRSFPAGPKDQYAGRIADSRGRPMQDVDESLALRHHDVRRRMNKARQMIEATKGADKLKWIRIRQQLNKELIEMQQMYPEMRFLPTESVKDLVATIKSVMQKGGIITNYADLKVGDEVIWTRGVESDIGMITLQDGKMAIKFADGSTVLIESISDIEFLMNRRLHNVYSQGDVPLQNITDVNEALKLIPKEQRPAIVDINISDADAFRKAMGDQYHQDSIGFFDPRVQKIFLDGKWVSKELVLHEVGHNIDSYKAFLPRKRFTYHRDRSTWYSGSNFWTKLYQKAVAGKAKYLRRYSLTTSVEYFADCYSCWVDGRTQQNWMMDFIPEEAVAWFDKKYLEMQAGMQRKYGTT